MIPPSTLRTEPAMSSLEATPTSVSAGRSSLVYFLASDAAGFAALLAAHTLLSTNAASQAVREGLSLPLAGTMTGLLLLSSFTAHRWLRTAGRGAWLSTLLLGAAFVGLQAFEWRQAIRAESMTVASSTFAATFYATTGFHGLHVIAGLLLFVLLGRRATPLAGAGASVFAHNAVLYWHFVDVVWVFVFLRVYVF